MSLAQSSATQLRELEITEIQPSGAIPVFTNHPDQAAIIITSTIPTLQFDSNLQIVNQINESAQGRYILIIPPARQAIRVSAPGYLAQSFPVTVNEARQVRYFRIEPKNVNITETGTLVIRTEPTGATLRLDGVPGTYTTPHTFSELLAQGYTARISLAGYKDEEVQVTVRADRPQIQTIELTPTFGFVTIRATDATLFLRDAGSNLEYRRTFTSGQPLRLDVGRYDYRFTRDNHADATGTFEITPNGNITLQPELIATFGFLEIPASGVTLFVRPATGGSESRLQGQPTNRHRLPVGSYQYRAERAFHMPAEGNFVISSNQQTVLQPEFRPAYGTLRISANALNFSLQAADNNAPPPPSNSAIYLEAGLHIVTISAPGFVSQQLSIRIEPGQTIEQSITLESVAQRDERVRREGLPQGVLEVSSDVNAEIFVDGVRRGQQRVALTLVPGEYTVELRHPAGSSKFRVNVPPADLVERYVELRPDRGRALTYAAALPGAGHLYRKDTRGYAYLALFAGAAVYTYTTFSGYQDNLSDYNEAQEAYLSNRSVTLAPNLRNAVLDHYTQVNDSRNALLIAGGILAGVYTIQLLDVLITSPRYGYRGSGTQRSLSFDGGTGRTGADNHKSLRLSARMDGAGFAIRGSF